MRVLLTGANGLLGQKLVPLFQADTEIDLVASGRGQQRFPDRAAYVEMDISNPMEIEEVFSHYNPDVVVNTAAMTDVDACELDHDACDRFNVEAVRYLTDSCMNNNSFFLHISTDFIFPGDKGPLLETDEPNPVNYYGESKLRSEEILMGSRISWAIARTVLVYGIVADMSRSNIILWVKRNLEESKQIRVVDDQFRTPTLAEDLAMGCYLIVKKEATGIFNISGKDMLTPYDMAMMTAEFYGLDNALIERVDSTVFKQPAKRPLNTGFVIEKARKELGYNPHSFHEGLEIVANQVEAAGE